VKAPSNAQAELLRLVADPPHQAEALLCTAGSAEWRVGICVEKLDRQRNVGRLSWMWEWPNSPRFIRASTVRAALREGWISDLHTKEWRESAMGEEKTWHFRELRLEQDGEIALGLWRERKLKAAPAPMPTMTDHEREIVELAQRALELGYALCARQPARREARRMRSAGWFERNGCWVANNPLGLVPTPTAVVEVRPDTADEAAA
jgi:hypothetical protein